jgi:L-threonine kinase
LQFSDDRPVLFGRAGQGLSNGTLGELVQGQTVAGEDFLVTFPVAVWSRARVVLNESGIVIGPAEKPKAKRMASLVLQRLGLTDVGASLEIHCGIPEGRGMASSTADIVATARAVCDATALTLEPGEIAELAIEIEPSDGVMWEGVVAFNHRQGRLLRQLGALPPMRILGVDLGGSVDTIQFNRRPKDYTPAERRACQEALEQVALGIQHGSLRQLAEACTLSARIHQRVLPKPELADLISVVEAAGGVGVNVAHSGTVVGLLFPEGSGAPVENARELIERRLPHARAFDVDSLPGRPIARARSRASE